jgi:hypothetical protein
VFIFANLPFLLPTCRFFFRPAVSSSDLPFLLPTCRFFF